MPIALTKYAKTKVYDEPLYKQMTRTQELYDIKSIDETGIFELNNKMFSKSYILSDINFSGVTEDEQKAITSNFSHVLNSVQCRFSYTVANEYNINLKNILFTDKGDRLDELRHDFNVTIKDAVTKARQGLYQTIYFTLTLHAEDLEEARTMFGNMEGSLRSAFITIGVNGMSGSSMRSLSIDERMQLLYRVAHAGIDTKYKFNFFNEIEMMHDWQDIIAPDNIDIYDDYFILNAGKAYGRVLYMSDMPKTLESDILEQLTQLSCTSYVTMANEPIDSTGLKSEIERKLGAVGLQIENQKQSNRNRNDFLSDASEKLLKQQETLQKFENDLTGESDKYFNSTMYILLLTNTKEELEKNTDRLVTAATLKSGEVKPCFNKQREAFNSVLPIGLQEFKRPCNLSGLSLSMYMPFRTQELNDPDGNFYGLNQLSQNAIRGNRKKLLNYNGMVLGKSGSGKSVFAKLEIIQTYINNPDDQIIVIDPQNEYNTLANHTTVGGERDIDGTIISFDSHKEVYVNPLDVDFKGVEYSQLEDVISEKSDFILTLLASCMRRDCDSEEQGILDEVVEKVYRENYAFRKKINGDGENNTEFEIPERLKTQDISTAHITELSNEEQIKQYSPTLQDIYQKLLDMGENNLTAKKLAGRMSLFVNGSLNLFNHRTNVDLNNNFLVFNISGIKDNLRATCMLVMLEIVQSKIAKNAAAGHWTHLYIDEFHELLSIPAVAKYVIKLWKEIRKIKGALTGITQNMTDLLGTSAAKDDLKAILSNTEYFALLNQSTIDKNILMEFLPSISPALFNFVEGAEPGTGLLKMGPTCIPFNVRMSTNSRIYKMVNTDNKTDAAV